MKVSGDLKFYFLLLCGLFMLKKWHKKAHKVGKEQLAANSLSGEDVLVGSQELILGQTSFQFHRDG